MSNRIVGNVIIVDSAMGNLFMLGSAVNVYNIKKFQVNAIAFFSADTTGAFTLTEANTAADIVYRFGYISGQAGEPASPNLIHFANPLVVGDLKCPVVTSGTGFIYLA